MVRHPPEGMPGPAAPPRPSAPRARAPALHRALQRPSAAPLARSAPTPRLGTNAGPARCRPWQDPPTRAARRPDSRVRGGSMSDPAQVLSTQTPTTPGSAVSTTQVLYSAPCRRPYVEPPHRDPPHRLARHLGHPPSPYWQPKVSSERFRDHKQHDYGHDHELVPSRRGNGGITKGRRELRRHVADPDR